MSTAMEPAVSTETEFSVDRDRYREAMGHFATGVTIVTTFNEEGGLVGFTANSFTALSISPPLVLVCPNVTSDTIPHIRSNGKFVINVLTEEQKALAEAFARKGTEKTLGAPFRTSGNGLPLLEGSQCWIECSIEYEFDGGDHTILVGRLIGLGVNPAPATPLLCVNGKLRGLSS